MNKNLKTTELNEKEIEFFFTAMNVASSSSSSSSSTSTTATTTTDPALKILQKKELDHALDQFRMAATNLSTSAEELERSKSQLLKCLHDSGLLEKTLKFHNERMQQLAAEDERKAAGKTTYKDKNCYTQTKMQEIVRNLWIGSWHPATDAPLLKNANVTHICSCINVKPRLEDQGFKYIVLPAEDNDQYDISQFFNKSFDFIDEAISKSGTGVLVFCGAGISRSTTIAAAYLMKKMKIKADDAVGMIQRVRQVARPNNGFMKQLRKFESELLL